MENTSHIKIVEEMVELFKALGDKNRLRIIRLLASNMESSLTVTKLAEFLGITQPAASQHLKVLKNIGLLEPNKQGYHVYYNLNLENFKKQKEKFDQLFNIAFTKCEAFLNHKNQEKD